MAIAVTSKPRFRAAITFWPPTDGGRTNPAHDSPAYRPHIVIEKRSLHLATGSADPDVANEKYLGIQFTGDGKILRPGKEYEVELSLQYYPAVDYGDIKDGASFTIREAGSVIGFGKVKGNPWTGP